MPTSWVRWPPPGGSWNWARGRAESRMKVRQVLKRMLVPTAALAELTTELVAEVRAELNVQDIASFTSAGDLVDHAAKGNFRALGKRFGKLTPKVAAAIAAADASRLARELRELGRSLIDLDGESLEVSADEVLLTERPRDGWSVVNEQGETVALDLELTPELVRAGRAREVIRVIQEARKSSGLDVSDGSSCASRRSGTAGGDPRTRRPDRRRGPGRRPATGRRQGPRPRRNRNSASR